MQVSTESRLVVNLGQAEAALAEAALAEAGGKGASLTRLLAADLLVPAGFLLTTEAYRQFVSENGLAADLDACLSEAARGVSHADGAAWERVSERLQARWRQARVPDAVAAAARVAYATLAGPSGDGVAPADVPVAVRSSATAEDLPEASFAGQQETVLNVVGPSALLDAVRECWASLWTARALAYRERLGIDHRTVAMAVVVQVMVPADVAGVLFTANPATGRRDEILVNASYGLGEAIVSGLVTPDTYVLDRDSLAVTATTIGTKSLRIVADAAVGTGTVSQEVAAAAQAARALTDAQLRELGMLSLRVERLFDGVPQDIEWAIVDGHVWLLQARPITGMPPVPLQDVRWEPPIPGSRWIRRQVVEHMPGPLSPLFEELYLHEGLDRSIDIIMDILEQPIQLDDLVDRPLFDTVNGFAYQRADIKFTWKTVYLMVTAIGRAMPSMFRVAIPYWRDQELPRYLNIVRQWKALDPATLEDERLLDGVRELAYADARYWFASALAIGVAKVSDGVLDSYLGMAAPGRHLTSGQFLRAFSQRGLAAEAALEEIAQLVRGSESVRQLVRATPPERLREALADSPAGQPVARALDAYFEGYGHLIYSLDFAEPTQVDDPLPVLLSLKALSEQPPRDPHAIQARLARERDTLTRQTDRSLDPVRRRLFRILLRWARRYAPYRDEALFYVGAAWPTLRRLAHELGRRLTERDVLRQPDDLFYLKPDEIAEAIGGRDAAELAGLATQAQGRRQLREARKRLQPPAAVPPAYTFKLGPIDLSNRESQRRNADDDPVLKGFAVSPGRVTAPASLILSPADFGQMQPGTVLVCPTTTPAWTPLFSQARALVTDIGGILAHGSVVAREYGIPAVMGTGTGTSRIQNGQVISVDGDSGTVTLNA